MAVLALTLPVTQSVAHPPDNPDHGVSETTHCTLWAGDEDVTNATVLRNRTEGSPSVCALASGTDVPLDSPPAAVERWNRGDLREFPGTNAETSISPPDATLRDGRFIREAYTEVFAVQPSTQARLSPTNQPLYVASNGTLLGTVDYRVAVPPDRISESRRIFWNLAEHEINETRLVVDGHNETTTSGTHTPELPYALADDAEERHTLALEAEITVELRKRVETCTARDNESTCIEWNNRTERPVETVTVRDTVDVVAYNLTISGFRATYPNGDLGLVVYKNQPWLGYTLPNGDVRGVWRFYAARDSDWDTLVVQTADNRTTTHSSLHPLQVAAYPIETGPTASPRRVVTILDTYGVETQPPSLPEAVQLDVLTEPYTASFGIATRTNTTDHDLESVTAYGLVRGVEADANESFFAEVPINRSDLSLTIVNATDETVTVRVNLQDVATGEPIQTANRSGYVLIQDHRVNTSANGTVAVTLPRAAGGISARYAPGHWWSNIPGYVGDSDAVYPRGTVLRLLAILYEIGVPVSLFLFGVFVIDRITGWRVWPPWRRL